MSLHHCGLKQSYWEPRKVSLLRPGYRRRLGRMKTGVFRNVYSLGFLKLHVFWLPFDRNSMQNSSSIKWTYTLRRGGILIVFIEKVCILQISFHVFWICAKYMLFESSTPKRCVYLPGTFHSRQWFRSFQLTLQEGKSSRSKKNDERQGGMNPTDSQTSMRWYHLSPKSYR